MAAKSALVGCVAVLCVPAAAAVAGDGAAVVVSNGGQPATIVDHANANPFPSLLKVEGGAGVIIDVNVRVTLTHSVLDDVDMALVSPEGDSTLLMSDVCGVTALTNATFTFDATAGNALNDDGPCSGGTVRPSIGTGTTSFPGGPAPGTADLTRFGGEDPNGQWRLFVVDDALGGGTGSISSWGLTITTSTSDVVIPGSQTSGIASPYPSTKNIPTPGEVITDVDVETGFSHSFPDDVDMLLQGPGGQAVMLMSDACGSDDIHRFTWTFDDEGADVPTDAIGAGCFGSRNRPSAFGEDEDLPPSAPPRPYASTLSVFDGLQGGDWSLFVNDDAGGDTGFIGAWNVVMTTRPAAVTGFTASSVATAEGQTVTMTVNRTGPVSLGPATVDVAVNHGGTDPSDIGAVPARLQFARGETSKSFEIPILADLLGEGSEGFAVSLANPTDDARLADPTFSLVTIDPSPPDNRFTVGAATKLPNGTAQIPVTIPNPGTLSSADAGPKQLLKVKEVDAPTAGETVLTLKPAKKAKRKLKRGKKVRLTAEVTYTPYDGSANSADVAVKLKKG